MEQKLKKRLTWRLRVMLAERNITTATELKRRLKSCGYEITSSQLTRIIRERPERISTDLLDHLLAVLRCEVTDLLRLDPVEQEKAVLETAVDYRIRRNRVETRLNELAQLQDGWLDGKGRALDCAGIKDLAEAFDKYFGPDLPLPRLYPTPEGGIQSEWTLGGWEVSLEIDLPTLVAEYQSMNMKTGEVHECEMKLVTKDDWSCLNNALATLRDGG